MSRMLLYKHVLTILQFKHLNVTNRLIYVFHCFTQRGNKHQLNFWKVLPNYPLAVQQQRVGSGSGRTSKRWGNSLSINYPVSHTGLDFHPLIETWRSNPPLISVLIFLKESRRYGYPRNSCFLQSQSQSNDVWWRVSLNWVQIFIA